MRDRIVDPETDDVIERVVCDNCGEEGHDGGHEPERFRVGDYVRTKVDLDLGSIYQPGDRTIAAGTLGQVGGVSEDGRKVLVAFAGFGTSLRAEVLELDRVAPAPWYVTPGLAEAEEARFDERGTGPDRYPLVLRDESGRPTDVG